MKITTKVMKNPVTPQKRHFVSRTVIDNSKRKSNQRNRPLIMTQRTTERS